MYLASQTPNAPFLSSPLPNTQLLTLTPEQPASEETLHLISPLQPALVQEPAFPPAAFCSQDTPGQGWGVSGELQHLRARVPIPWQVPSELSVLPTG